MKILLGHKYFHQVGGAETYFLSLFKLLKAHGHHLSIFSMHDPKNLPSPWAKYFVSHIDLRNLHLPHLFKSIPRLFTTQEANRQINRLLDAAHPDLAHFQSLYFHLPPSVLRCVAQRHIPIIYTVHDYHLISSNPNLTVSLTPQRFLLAISRLYHKFITPTDQFINFYLAPSRFMQQKLLQHGISPRKIIYLPNFIQIPRAKTLVSQKFILYAGRLTRHKGVPWLLQVARLLPQIPFVFVGNGPLVSQVTAASRQLPNVTYHPYTSQPELFKFVSQAVCVVVPSLWAENQPYSILEAYIHHKPVISTRIGGIPEIVSSGQTGLLVSPGDTPALVAAISKLWTHQSATMVMGQHAFDYAVSAFAPGKYYQSLTQVYKLALSKKTSS